MELHLDHVRKSFGATTAVRELCATYGPGVHGLLGQNGAGKTTLLRMLCGLIRPTQGQILYNGTSLSTLGASYRATLGYLPQAFGFYPDFTVEAYLRHMCALKGIAPRATASVIDMRLEEVGLTAERRKKLKHLSGGMLRRAGIAQAVLNDPEVLLLDEPTTGLDPNERVRFRNLIAGMAKNRIVILSTHIVSDIEAIADTISLMQRGAFRITGTRNDLLRALPIPVWEGVLPHGRTASLEQQHTIASVHSTPTGEYVRVLSEAMPFDGATLASPTLEEVFLAFVAQSTEVRHA